MTHRVVLLAVMLTAAACGSSYGPTTPSTSTTPPADPGPAVNNTPPVIGTFTVQGSRSNEPANFADASETVNVTVKVTDAESAISDLKFNWSADSGTFNGSGASVTWTAPALVGSPTSVTLNLEVVETYTSQGKSVQNKVTGSTTLSLHDSVKEVGDMALQFLNDFSNSSVGVVIVMRNFQPDCYGTAEETGDVVQNRENYTITHSDIGLAKTTVAFGGVCSFRGKPGDACARVPSHWKSIANKDVYDQFGQLAAFKGQQTETPFGVDQVAAMYYKDLRQWKLCDSQYNPANSSLRAVRGLVP